MNLLMNNILTGKKHPQQTANKNVRLDDRLIGHFFVNLLIFLKSF